ncbi:YhfC family intramembrane metalloprotease [Priestia megaterium]|uniref:YhfC family intramembrane metalloprotease n=1 Tax=Priestia megaterium TaxID=1404 RepID=UPI0022B91A80|nr:YhfC family glutamic-type intramembrane protease [Priestia megaterium]MCZ8497360.1 YhfC family glutamic-type intramembrane protease [Priestia megaterium]
MVSQQTINFITFSMVLSFLFPILLVIIMKVKYKMALKSVLIGALTFFVFAQILEGTLHSIILKNSIFENPWVYMLYAGIMAGAFEEVGRFIMIKSFLKKNHAWKDGVGFGIGHGGLESILLVGITNITMLSYATLINKGNFETLFTNKAIKDTLMPIQENLINSSSYLWLLSGIERGLTIFVHIALSLLVLQCIRSGTKKLLFLAICLHAFLNFPTALYQKGVITNVFIVEAIIALFALLSIVFIIKYKRNSKLEVINNINSSSSV